MRWLKLDVNFASNPKLIAVGPHAAYVYIRGLAYCVANLTDGMIPKKEARRWAGKSVLQRLITIHPGQHNPLWFDIGWAFNVHDFSQWQETKEQVEERARRNRLKVQNYRKSTPM